VSFLKDAYDKAKAHPSKKAEPGPHGEAIHLMRVLLNRINGASELSDTQATSFLLGIMAQSSSASFSYVFVRDACIAVDQWRSRQGRRQTMPDLADASDDENDAADDDADDDGCLLDIDAVQPTDNVDRELAEQEEMAWRTERQDDGNAPVSFGTAKVYPITVNKKSIKVAFTPFQLYRDRGDEMLHLSFLEWSCMVKVDKVPKKKSDDEDDEEEPVHPRRNGRRPNLCVGFHPSNRLHGHYHAELRSKFSIPIWAGSAPPHCPEMVAPGSTASADTHAKMELFAQRMIVALCPTVTHGQIAQGTHQQPDLGLPWAFIDTSEDEAMRTDFQRLCSFMQHNTATFIGRSRNALILQLSDNVANGCKAEISKLLYGHRGRMTTHWNQRLVDCCQVDERIGKRRTRHNASSASALAHAHEDDAVALDMLEWQNLMKKQIRSFPTAADREMQAFLNDTHQSLADILGAAEDAAATDAGAAPRTAKPAIMVPRPAVLDSAAREKDIWTELSNNKCAKPDYTSGGKTGVSDGLHRPRRALAPPNASQQHALDCLLPKIKEYQQYNIGLLQAKTTRPEEADAFAYQHRPAPAHFLVTGGPVRAVDQHLLSRH